MTEIPEKVPDGAAAMGIAGLDLAQKLMLYLIEQELLPPDHAVAMLRDSAKAHQNLMDEIWAPRHERAAHILETIAQRIEKNHGLDQSK